MAPLALIATHSVQDLGSSRHGISSSEGGSECSVSSFLQHSGCAGSRCRSLLSLPVASLETEVPGFLCCGGGSSGSEEVTVGSADPFPSLFFNLGK